MSIFREEATDTLISCLRNTEFPSAQIAAAETIMSLQGRFTTSGKPLARAFLLKRAGIDKIYKQRVRMDQLSSFSGEDETLVSFFFFFFCFEQLLLTALLNTVHLIIIHMTDILIMSFFWLTSKG